jgi:hypothetical protein
MVIPLRPRTDYEPDLNHGAARRLARHVEERFREQPFGDQVMEVEVSFPWRDYNIGVKFNASRDELPSEALWFCSDLNDELRLMGYPVNIYLEPTQYP